MSSPNATKDAIAPAPWVITFQNSSLFLFFLAMGKVYTTKLKSTAFSDGIFAKYLH